MEYVYDNSAANPRNPDHPPRRVRFGQFSNDEMGDLWLQLLPRSEADRQLLVRTFMPKVVNEDIVGYESMLAADPDKPGAPSGRGGVVHDRRPHRGRDPPLSAIARAGPGVGDRALQPGDAARGGRGARRGAAPLPPRGRPAPRARGRAQQPGGGPQGARPPRRGDPLLRASSGSGRRQRRGAQQLRQCAGVDRQTRRRHAALPSRRWRWNRKASSR